MKNKAEQNKDKEKQVSRAAADFAVTGRHPVAIMPKLEVGQPGDHFEQEADIVADRIVQMPDSNLARKSEDEKDKVQTKPLGKETAPWIQRFSNNEALQAKSDHGIEALSWLENQLRSSKGNGQTLPASASSFMENRFGADFGNVKIHADNKASTLSSSINAKAFTHGSDIYFAKNQFNPETQTGKHLLAHELTHVVQQGGGDISRSMIQKADETKDVPAISTPIPKDLEADDTGEFQTTINGIKVTIQPDAVSDEEGTGAETHISSNVNLENYNWDSKNKITSFTEPSVSAIIKTTYQKDAKKTAESLYGRGTTAEDKKAGNTSLRFHEGSHGADFLQYMKNNAPPKFEGTVGSTKKDFEQKVTEYKAAMKKYFKDMNRASEISTDCVGTTIDDATESTICPK